IWNKLPADEQFYNSNVIENASKLRKSSLKKSSKNKVNTTNIPVEEISKLDCENAILYGAVSVDKSQIINGNNLYTEILAKFRYSDHRKVPSFPEVVDSECLCYREILQLSPRSYNDDGQINYFVDNLLASIKKKLGKGCSIFLFHFDLTHKLDSIFFNCPYYPNFINGLFWSSHAFTAMDKDCNPLPGCYITMKFYKHTISPVLKPITMETNSPSKYIRYSTRNDTGDLILEVQLDRDVYYHGQDIHVRISVENNSSRHVVQNIAVFIEQTYRLYHHFPHDKSIPLG
ncbi:unnamed protein product, partial [Heterobilharzia americana]